MRAFIMDDCRNYFSGSAVSSNSVSGSYVLSVGALLLLVFITGCSSNTYSNKVSTTQSTAERSIPTNPVVFVRDGQVIVSDATGETQQDITDDAYVHSAPIWLPDEETIVYVTQINSHFELWKHNVRTNASELLIGLTNEPMQLAASPNGLYLLYIADDNLYVLDFETGLTERMYEGVLSASWSFDSKKIVYATTDTVSGGQRLLLQEFGINGSLTDAVVLLDQAVVSPVFLNARTVLYEADWDGQYTVLALDLDTVTAEPFTSLRFNALDTAASILIEPAGRRVLYSRHDDATEQSNVWMIDPSNTTTSLVLTNVAGAIWSSEAERIFYVDLQPDEENVLLPAVYSATAAGLQKQEVSANSHSVVSPVYTHSNKYQ